MPNTSDVVIPKTTLALIISSIILTCVLAVVGMHHYHKIQTFKAKAALLEYAASVGAVSSVTYNELTEELDIRWHDSKLREVFEKLE